MTTDEVLMFIKAGYTKQDIEAFSAPLHQTPENSGTESEDKAPETSPEEPEHAAPELPGIAELIRSNELLREQIKAMQSKNIRETDGGMPEKVGADQVIKDFFGLVKRKE